MCCSRRRERRRERCQPRHGRRCCGPSSRMHHQHNDVAQHHLPTDENTTRTAISPSMVTQSQVKPPLTIDPPSYEAAMATSSTLVVGEGRSPAHSKQQYRPIVIPQALRTAGIRTEYTCPFIRADAPTLRDFGIGAADFLQFIDDLNVAFMGPAALKALNAAGGATSMAPLPLSGLFGSYISLAASAGSAGFSLVRVKKCIRNANQAIFAPRGLRVRLQKTPKMLRSVDVDEHLFEKAELSKRCCSHTLSQDDIASAYASKEEMASHRLHALQGFIAPLDIKDEPALVGKSDPLSKFTDWYVRQVDRRQSKETSRAMDKAREGHFGDLTALNRRERKAVRKMRWIVIVQDSESEAVMAGTYDDAEDVDLEDNDDDGEDDDVDGEGSDIKKPYYASKATQARAVQA